MAGRLAAPRRIRFQDDMSFMVELTKDCWAQVDATDLPRVIELAWHASPNAMGGYYAVSREHGRTVYMHRLIMDAPKGRTVDHLSHDTLDNRRANLRVGGQSDNLLNRKGANSNSSTGVRGLYEHRTKGQLYYNIRVMLHRRSITKNFPFTEQGKADAMATVSIWQADPAAAFSQHDGVTS